jgi:ligand-binding SRPBCC domain-containing protein
LTRGFTYTSRLQAPRPEVWARVSTMAGVNAELGGLFRMTAPAAVTDLASFPTGRRAFRSWILLLGVLPLDFDDLTLVEIEPGARFLERSRMASARAWEHERTLADRPGGGTEVTDRIAFEPRVATLAQPQARLFAAVFARRHRRLRAWDAARGPGT